MSGWEILKNTGQAAWQVIKDGQPSAEIQSGYANAVPDVSDWQNLRGAPDQPNIYYWPLTVTNSWPFEKKVIDIQFELKWMYGARYNGGGAFIPNLWIHVPHCRVLWGWSCDIKLTVGNPDNASNDTGRPIARVPVTVHGTTSSGLETTNYQWDFTLRGDGNSNYQRRAGG